MTPFPVPGRAPEGPLHLLIDNNGINAEGEGEWHARKHGGPKRRGWRKIHLGFEEETLEVRAVEITGSHIGDAPVLPELLKQVPAHEQIGSVTTAIAREMVGFIWLVCPSWVVRLEG